MFSKLRDDFTPIGVNTVTSFKLTIADYIFNRSKTTQNIFIQNKIQISKLENISTAFGHLK